MSQQQQRPFLLVKAQKAVLSSENDMAPATVLVDRTTGKITQVATDNETIKVKDDMDVIELQDDQVLIPGLVDAHGKYTHINLLD